MSVSLSIGPKLGKFPNILKASLIFPSLPAVVDAWVKVNSVLKLKYDEIVSVKLTSNYNYIMASMLLILL